MRQRVIYRIAWRSVAAVSAVVMLLAGVGKLAPTTARPSAPGDCPRVDVVSARGQHEPPGTAGAMLAPMAGALADRLPPTVALHAVPYDAGSNVIASANDGIQRLADHLSTMRSRCPATRFVVLGFSLGALVVGEAFAPDTRYPGIRRVRLPKAVESRVAAVVLFGDSRFNARDPHAYGTFRAGVSGQFPRPAAAFARWGNRVRLVCNQNDAVCQSGAPPSGDTGPHQDYVKYTDALVTYVASQLAPAS